MDQLKIGRVLKELRTEKGLTQTQLAEEFGVSNRTISRWETGASLPDISLLIEVADFYQVDLRDLLDGESEAKEMDSKTKDTVKKAAKYTEGKYDKIIQFAHLIFIIALIGLILNVYLVENNFFGSPILEFISGIGTGMATGIVIVGAIFTSPWMKKYRQKL